MNLDERVSWPDKSPFSAPVFLANALGFTLGASFRLGNHSGPCCQMVRHRYSSGE